MVAVIPPPALLAIGPPASVTGANFTLLFAIFELDPPAEQHAGDDPVAAADLGGGAAGKPGLFYNGALFFVGETAAANMFAA